MTKSLPKRLLSVFFVVLLLGLLPAEMAFAQDNRSDKGSKFYGNIQQMPAGTLVGTWVVSARTVNVSPTTRIEQKYGQAVVGAYVEVEGFQQADGSISATKIEVKSGSGSGIGGMSIKFYGTVEAMPANGLIGDWTIDGRTVHVLPTTKLEQKKGLFRVGAHVEVKGLQQTNGSINATKIEVKR